MRHVWKQKVRCTSCGGTGLYKGLGEKGKVAVVCHICKGSGCQEIKVEWYDFISRQKRKEDIVRVIQINPGLIVDEREEWGGIPYEDWLAGKIFPPKSENRILVCPAWWYQSANYKLKPDWVWCNEALGMGFSSCPHFKKKDRCWSRWDKKFGKELVK